MLLDFPTLLTVTVFVSAVAGLLLVFTWVQNRASVSLGMWGAAYLMSGLAMGVLAAYRRDFDVALVEWAMALWLAAHGLMWAAARHFEGRRTPVALVLAGAAIWLVANQVEALHASLQARVMLSSSLIGIYTLLCAREIWNAQNRELMSRWPAIALLAVHGVLFLGRVPFVGVLPFPGGIQPADPHWFPVGIFELLFHTFCMSVLLVNMAKERAELRQRQNSLIDPLTGVANRRAFFDRGEVLLRRTRAEGNAAVLMLFDLDRFKAINDTFGHQAGDRVLSRFCETAGAALRPHDLFGRFGGEEFGCLMVNVSLGEAMRVAERIRAAFAATVLDFGTADTQVTVSVGVAMSKDADAGLERLFTEADGALYRAKAKGRNCVEAVRVPLLLIEPAKDASPKRPVIKSPSLAAG